MIFQRKSYLQELISAESNGMIKVITGIRRCGKSFLLFNLYKNHLVQRGVKEDHIIQVNLEDRRNRKLRNPDALLSCCAACRDRHRNRERRLDLRLAFGVLAGIDLVSEMG